MRSESYSTTPLARFQLPALAIGIVAILACVFGAMHNPDQFFRSYLFGFIFWLEVALGSLAILCIQYLTGGVWGMLIRRNLEAGAKTIPLMAIAFLPIAFGLQSLYVWAHADHVANDPVLKWKSHYLDPQWFYIRAAIYFLLWSLLTLRLVKLAREHEESLSPWTALKMRRTSAATLVVLGLSITFAAIDWVMSIEPHWFSTMYGFLFMVHALLSAHAIAILVLIRNSRLPGVIGTWTRIHFRDLGNLLLAFTMLWAYTNFCQFLLIWYGNLREETPWYIRRSQGGWLYIAAALLILHFFVPFFLLLNRPVKERPRNLAMVCVLLLVMHLVDLFWLIMPGFYGTGFHFHWLDLAAPLAIGGVWFYFYLANLKRRPLLPGHEPYIREALTHG